MARRSRRKRLGTHLVVATIFVVLLLAESTRPYVITAIAIIAAGFVLPFAIRLLRNGTGPMFGPGADATFAELDRMSGREFEAWITRVLRSHGFAVHDTPHAGDFGVDVLCSPPGSSDRIAIQAKRYKNSVGNDAVQQAIAGAQYYDCAGSAVVTQSRFTRAARSQAKKADPPVLLIDRTSIRKMPGLLSSLLNTR